MHPAWARHSPEVRKPETVIEGIWKRNTWNATKITSRYRELPRGGHRQHQKSIDSRVVQNSLERGALHM